MCRPIFSLQNNTNEKKKTSSNASDVSTCVQTSPSPSRPRIPLSVALLVLPFAIPSSWYINRGYTQWFHGMAMLQFITDSTFFAQFCALQGLTVCSGWYACMICDFAWHGRFGHLLYRNMPRFLMDYIIEDYTKDTHDVILKNDTGAYIAMAMAHVLDFLGHPILCYYFWRQCHLRQTEMAQSVVLTWTIIFSTYLFSRIWSITQSYVNYGQENWQLHYVGTHVYDIPNESLHLWYPAYVAEAICYLIICIWKSKHYVGHVKCQKEP